MSEKSLFTVLAPGNASAFTECSLYVHITILDNPYIRTGANKLASLDTEITIHKETWAV